MNQYFDKEKGFCLNVLGGGKALYINNTSCGINVLKPHCFDPRYYYICKKNKTILAQCSQNKHFEIHLQKCTLIYHGKNTPNKTNSNSCQKVGVFPIANDCHQFYTCTAYGHRMKQNFYICPKNMAFDTKTEMCKPSSTCKESRLSSTCLFSSEKEDMTLEEANMFLRPMDQKEKSLTCETIFTNDEETITTERNYNNDEIKSTTTSYNKPPISEFTEPSDRNITTTIERASGTSHSTNTVVSEIYTTAIYSPANEEITYTTEQNLPTEIKKNGEGNLESSTSKESYKQEYNGKTVNNNVQSTDAMKTFFTEPTILDDTTSREMGSETQSDIEIKILPNESPNFENQYSTTKAEFNDATHHWYESYTTPATKELGEPLDSEKKIIDLPLAIHNNNNNSDVEEPEINLNDSSSEILNTTQPNIEIPNSTPATENLNESLATEKEIIDLLPPATDIINNSNLDVDEYMKSKMISNNSFSEILNTGEHNVEIPNNTSATIKFNESIEEENSDFISIMTNNDSDVKEQEKTDINLNDPLSEILITGVPNIEMEHNIVTTMEVIEQSTFKSESPDIVSKIPFNTLTTIKENDIHTIINVNDSSMDYSSMEITTPSLENHVTNGGETFMKISNNDETENNVFAESVTNAIESSSISENINNNFQNYVSPISADPASYSGMISENKIEEPTSIPITNRIALNKNQENNTASTEFNVMKTNSPIERNTKYTTISISKNLDNIRNDKLTLSSDTDISETDKSISQANKLTTSFRDLIAKCRNHMSAETTTQSTKSNPANEKYSDPFHMQSHSLVSDKKNADKQNKIFVEEDSLSKRMYSGKTISKNFILPITSAVLNFIDKFECYLKNTLIKIFH